MPVWLLLTQKGPVGLNATPQGLIRFGSCIDALRCPVWLSDTKLDWLNSRPLEAIASFAASSEGCEKASDVIEDLVMIWNALLDIAPSVRGNQLLMLTRA